MRVLIVFLLAFTACNDGVNSPVACTQVDESGATQYVEPVSVVADGYSTNAGSYHVRCPDYATPVDIYGEPTDDTASTDPSSGRTFRDAGHPLTDAGTHRDAGHPVIDGGRIRRDAGTADVGDRDDNESDE